MTERIWTDDRFDELEQLEELIRDVAAINSSNGCVERISRCIQTAEYLQRTNLHDRRTGFMRWLRDQAISDIKQSREPA